MKFSALILASILAPAASGLAAVNPALNESVPQAAIEIWETDKLNAMLEENPVVFVPAVNSGNDLPDGTAKAKKNLNYSELAYKYYFKAGGNIIEGELYKTDKDSPGTIERLKRDIYDKVVNGELTSSFDNAGIYYGSFDFGDAYIPVHSSTVVRSVDANFNGENLGIMTDYENAFILNNPDNSEKLFMIVTHETYLSPRQTDNRNFKGVGVEMKLGIDSADGFFIRDYSPTTQNPSKTVESPKILSKGSMPTLVDIDFEYVDPGSWYGDFCEYNSGETKQCSLVVLEVPKSYQYFNYTSSVTGRFQKYQNWPFPWVDEYYNIDVSTTYNVSALCNLIAEANA